MCAWSGPVYVLLFAGGMIGAGFFPPPPESWSAAQIAALYTDHPTRIMIGILFVMAAQGLWVAFSAANLWLAFMSIPSTGLFFFKTGPFSWTGVLSFWFAALAFFL